MITLSKFVTCSSDRRKWIGWMLRRWKKLLNNKRQKLIIWMNNIKNWGSNKKWKARSRGWEIRSRMPNQRLLRPSRPSMPREPWSDRPKLWPCRLTNFVKRSLVSEGNCRVFSSRLPTPPEMRLSLQKKSKEIKLRNKLKVLRPNKKLSKKRWKKRRIHLNHKASHPRLSPTKKNRSNSQLVPLWLRMKNLPPRSKRKRKERMTMRMALIKQASPISELRLLSMKWPQLLRKLKLMLKIPLKKLEELLWQYPTTNLQ